jgi:dTDP-4-amino-4,6-dideoxygalactose transaminase
VANECQSNNHLFYIILEDENIRNALMDHLKSNGILAVFHYIPLHLSPIGRAMGYTDGQLPVTESMSARLLRLPFYFELKQEEQMQVVKCIKDFFKMH